MPHVERAATQYSSNALANSLSIESIERLLAFTLTISLILIISGRHGEANVYGR